MKTAFKAKIVIETDKYSGAFGEEQDVTLITNSPEDCLTMLRIKDHINNKKIDIEMIGDFLTNDSEPVLIIKLK